MSKRLEPRTPSEKKKKKVRGSCCASSGNEDKMTKNGVANRMIMQEAKMK